MLLLLTGCVGKERSGMSEYEFNKLTTFPKQFGLNDIWYVDSNGVWSKAGEVDYCNYEKHIIISDDNGNTWSIDTTPVHRCHNGHLLNIGDSTVIYHESHP